jgi:nucleotide-binding universal stress UspA family protein
MPFPYRKILCPVDFDETSAQALKEAVAIAAPGGGTVCLLHVVQINPLAAQGAAEGLSAGELYDTQVEFARRQLEQMVKELPAGLKHELATEIGEPADIIVAEEKNLGADLVVMATHGRRGLKRLVLGSVAERVVRESSVPVLTIRPGQS